MPPCAEPGRGAAATARRKCATDDAAPGPHGVDANRAVAAMALRGSLLEALETAQRELAEHPTDTDLLNNVGCIVLFGLGETSWSRAEDCFRRSLQSDPLNAAAMYNYAKLLSMRPHSHRHNKKCAARQLLRAACQLNPVLPGVILDSRALLLAESAAARQQEADGLDGESSASAASRQDSGSSADASPSEEHMRDGGDGGRVRKQAVRFGVNSRAHARSTLKSAAGNARRENGKTRGDAPRKTLHETCKQRTAKRRCLPLAESSEGQDSTCLAALQSADSAALVFCTSLARGKVVAVAVRVHGSLSA